MRRVNGDDEGREGGDSLLDVESRVKVASDANALQ